ncbi:FAD-dependent oxidoreductase [Siculibacillus lacustris]|uniref:FAD-dependent oxidoreductase n=1 Tax=Siculibacillus lacustris TaxID=1549641 RepID=A0A4Q9VTL9_9HYPH|nr:FAD-dependent oxidoreductase [Siculibacillus lacustris]TBW38949.1 FAD-dependent oxidoreductase [Siculibacillus lacustris]
MTTPPDRPVVEIFDVVVVGAGAGGLTAAATAARSGASVLVLEQAAVVGGTTAISGGMVWLPANRKTAAAGRPDTIAAAKAYLAATLPPLASGGERARLGVFLDRADAALAWLEANTELRFKPVMTYPDYEPNRPGATAGGRVLEPVAFDARALGRAFALVRDPLPEFMLFGGMMVARADIPHLRRATRSPRSAVHVARLLLRHGFERLRARRGTTLHLGNALVARLLKSVLDAGVTLRTGTAVDAIERDGEGRVRFVDTPTGRIEARRGVILATGGISHDRELRRRHVPPAAGDLTATVDHGGAACGARLAVAVAARFSEPGEAGAFWVPASTFTRADGGAGVFPHTVTDRAKPGLVAVGRDGRRFVNEAISYHAFVRAQLAAAERALPAFLVCDADFLWRYGLGRVRPFMRGVESHVASGYLKRADTIAGLARAIGVPEDAFAETIETFDRDAVRGEDPAFGRGGDVYQRALGDADHGPNPCVAPIVTPPFYAVEVRPADLGMAAGLLTDTEARVLGADGRPIPGLWACGNDMASIMEGAYPGPGITLGPALVFGWTAGRRAASAEGRA